ncbi:MAG: hypothetical protein K2M07_05780 [Muribaculaceae bacterium]|nr:hypothetical protein [Muribaculaceae bacterium]
MEKQSEHLAEDYEKALNGNIFIHRYIIAIDHALLWIAALSLAAYFHLSHAYLPHEALLFSTLVAYGAYLFESLLGTVKETAASSFYSLDFRKAGMWKWIALNISVNTVLSIMFLHRPSWLILMMIIATAGWQKYMDGRIPPRLQRTRKPLDYE